MNSKTKGYYLASHSSHSSHAQKLPRRPQPANMATLHREAAEAKLAAVVAQRQAAKKTTAESFASSLHSKSSVSSFLKELASLCAANSSASAGLRYVLATYQHVALMQWRVQVE